MGPLIVYHACPNGATNADLIRAAVDASGNCIAVKCLACGAIIGRET